MIKTESFSSEAHFSPKSETEFENETERDCGIALWALGCVILVPGFLFPTFGNAVPVMISSLMLNFNSEFYARVSKKSLLSGLRGPWGEWGPSPYRGIKRLRQNCVERCVFWNQQVGSK